MRTFGCRTSCNVLDEQSADPESHRIGLDEQIIEFARTVLDREDHGESKRSVLAVNCHSNSPVRDRLMGRLDRIGVSRKMHPVFIPNIRRTALERL